MKISLSKPLLAAVIGSVVSITAIAQDATGAGATFPAPIYAKWAEGYKAATGKAINYQSMVHRVVSSKLKPNRLTSVPPMPRCQGMRSPKAA